MTLLFIPFFEAKKLTPSNKEFATEDLPSFDPPPVSSYLEMDPFDIYVRDERSGWLALGGVCATILISIISISFGIFLAQYRHTTNDVVLPPGWRNAPLDPIHAVYCGIIAFLPASDTIKTDILSFLMNIIVTICTESLGFVHSATLKSALAAESRLHCNTNLRLFTAARGNQWTNPNGTLCNIIMGLLLIVSYASSTLVFIPFQSRAVDDSSHGFWWCTCVHAVPILILGIALLLQAIIVIAGLFQMRVLTWSCSPLDLTAALLHTGQLTRISGRCMHDVLSSTAHLGPRLPSERQPSAWQSHPNIKKITIAIWCLVPMCVVWGGLVVYIWRNVYFEKNYYPGVESWNIFPNENTNTIAWGALADPDHGVPVWCWAFLFGSFIVLQGLLTIGLHCSEVIANVLRDEATWRGATTRKGTQPSKNALLMTLRSWPNMVVLAAKPVLRKWNLCPYCL
jgi:hypothetical protein